MSYIIYNGTDTRTLGVMVERMPEATRAQRQTETAAPAGYDGAIITDNGAYDTITGSFTLNCFGSVAPADLFAVYTGCGWLTTSDAPARRRYVYFYPEQSSSRLRRSKCYDSVTLSYTADPYCYELTPEALTPASGDLIAGQGDADARPLIKLTGTGSVTLMVGAVSLIISGLTASQPLYIDSATKFAYVITSSGSCQTAYSAGITVTMDTSISDRWPVLSHTGSTAISWTGSASVQVTPNWRWF